MNVIVTLVYDEEWVEILTKLGFTVKYMAGLPELRNAAVSAFPGVHYEIVSDFLSGIEERGETFVTPPRTPLDFALLHKLSEYEFNAKYMINREYDHGHEPTNEIYFDLIGYWLKIIADTTPDLVIVPYTPYTAREYILYALCRVMKIPVLSFHRATVGYYLNIPFSDPYEDLDEVIYEYHILKSNQHPFWIQDYANQNMKRKSAPVTDTILTDRDLLLQKTVEFHTLTLLRNYFKDTHIAISGLPVVPAVKRIWFDVKNLPAMLDKVQPYQNLKFHYDNLCTDPDYSKPYVFFPLHYQPEQTTCPFGGYSVYQYLPVEMVANSLPDGWLLYVKEHYVTFSPFHGGIKKRNRAYYERLAKIPNVRLIRSEVPSITLIDHSQAVATITGSPGYEAILRGKPALTFGSAWYNGCDGVFRIYNHHHCKRVLDQIRTGVTIDPCDFLLFVQATERIGALVNWSFSMKEIGDASISREDTVKNMVTLISRWCAERHITIQ